MTSSTILHRLCSRRVRSAQAIQLTSPPAQLEELSHPTKDVLLRSQFSSGHSAHEPTSSVSRAQPPNSRRVTQESIQLRHSANSASAPGAQQLRMTSSTILHRPCSLGVRSAQAIQFISLPAQLEELSHPTQDVLLKSRFSSNIQPTRPQCPKPSSSE